MRRLILLGLAITMVAFCYAQKKWDGGGNNNQWNNDQNWFPDGIPVASDSVVLDNAFVFVSLYGGTAIRKQPCGNSKTDY